MHVIRMSHYSYLLSKAIGANDEWCDLLFEAAPMHDIGKIGTTKITSNTEPNYTTLVEH